MAVIGGPIPKPQPLARPKPITVGPQNQGLPTYRPGDVNNPSGALQGVLPAAATAAAPVPPPDFNALVNADPNYINAEADRNAANQRALEALRHGFAQTAQSYQDQANSHGGLFSGPAVNAQRNLAQQYTQQQAGQAAGNLQAQHANIGNAWQRILNQLAGVA